MIDISTKHLSISPQDFSVDKMDYIEPQCNGEQGYWRLWFKNKFYIDFFNDGTYLSCGKNKIKGGDKDAITERIKSKGYLREYC